MFKKLRVPIRVQFLIIALSLAVTTTVLGLSAYLTDTDTYQGTFKTVGGRVEGTDGMIKQLRRAGYGYQDDEYFFLEIFDASRRYSSGRESVTLS